MYSGTYLMHDAKRKQPLSFVIPSTSTEDIYIGNQDSLMVHMEI
jgi:hypothetical protein